MLNTQHFQYFLSVGVGGFLGSILRYFISISINKLFINQEKYLSHTSNKNLLLLTLEKIPLSTLAVNIIGSLLIGFFIAYFQKLSSPNESLKLFLTTGLMGGLTTFSTLSFELTSMLIKNDISGAILYSILSLSLGVLFCFLAYYITNSLFLSN